MRTPEPEFLQWIHDRLVNVHGENYLYDYMWRLREIIEDAKKRTDLQNLRARVGEKEQPKNPSVHTQRKTS